MGCVQHVHRQFGLVLVDQHADLDLAGQMASTLILRWPRAVHADDGPHFT